MDGQFPKGEEGVGLDRVSTTRVRDMAEAEEEEEGEGPLGKGTVAF